MKAKLSLYVTALMLLAILTVGVGCTKAPNDAQLTSNIQTKLAADSGLTGKQLGVKAEGGTVTLTGTVDNDAEREAAARYAAAEPGVKQVINNLQVALHRSGNCPSAATGTAGRGSQAFAVAQAATARAARARHASALRTTQLQPAPVASMTPPAPVAAVPSTPPPPPPPRKVTIPSGTTLAVRLVDTIDSETSQQGQTFHATLDSPLAVEGEVAIPCRLRR